MESITLPVFNTEGKEIETITLDKDVFDGSVNSAAIHQAVTAYRANQRKGLASTKDRGAVSGGGVKPWRQKGTGRARVGSRRSPLWRHGGVTFGPHPRDFSYHLPDKIRILALRSALCAKLKENNLLVLDKFQVSQPKTKEASGVFVNLRLAPAKNKKRSSVLFLLEKVDESARRCLGNIGFLDINRAKDTHAYEVLSHKKLLITKEGLSDLTQRLKK